MAYSLLGPSGVKVSKICLGTATSASNPPSLLAAVAARRGYCPVSILLSAP